MAGGAGFVSDMIKTIRNNKNLKDNPYYKSKSSGNETHKDLIDPITATPEILQEIRQQMKVEKAKEAKRTVILLLCSILIFTIAAVIILSFFT